MQKALAIFYYHLFRACLSALYFSHYHIDVTIFRKEVIEPKTNFFILSPNYFGDISFSKKNSARCCYKWTFVFMYSNC